MTRCVEYHRKTAPGVRVRHRQVDTGLDRDQPTDDNDPLRVLTQPTARGATVCPP